MNKTIQYVLWTIALIAINITAIPVALFSLFTSESLLSLDGIIALLIVLIPNIASVQLMVAIKQNNPKNFVIGLLAVVGIALAFLLFIQTVNFAVCMSLLVVSLVASIALLVLQLKNN
ncbi:MAG: hypothetical protein ACI35O_11530 [Bacillaceae bacterium]